MKTFKNKNFVKRHYECTNIVFCQGEEAPDDQWQEVSIAELYKTRCEYLMSVNNVKYFGYL